ncbi:MAG: hypothetical protein JO262_01535 [Solirubrobacterales bacterium]|nr:hypothetical protein [Solirubrobacterales bacterium]
MATWTAETSVAGLPDDVLELLTQPKAIASLIGRPKWAVNATRGRA